MRDLRAATTFLTRLRVGGDVGSSEDIARGVPWFPVVGAVVGVLVAGVYVAAGEVLPSLVASAVAVGAGVVVTGAFHEDGLADTADAFGGARGREETLRILKDPRLGTFGVAALGLDILIRIGAVAALEGTDALLIVPAAHALSRAGAVALLAGPVATEAGLGASYASAVDTAKIVAAMAAGLAIGAVALGAAVAPSAVGLSLVVFLVARMARTRLGGVTGDVMGCAQQLGEIVVLLVGVAVVQRDWLPIPWWSS